MSLASRSSELTARALRRASESERIAGNAVTLLCDGPQVFRSWLHDIERAERFILLENYIFSGDRIGARIADALIARAQAGIEVYVLYDWFGSLSTSSGQWARMKRAGINVRACQPFAFSAPVASFRRNHRKA
ncbi:MAG TPA: cardiolipin synthase B, partial [Pseudomonadota bacterium]|nr:cardiolipin synthase B [Pseudomonadota bacterium]